MLNTIRMFVQEMKSGIKSQPDFKIELLNDFYKERYDLILYEKIL